MRPVQIWSDRVQDQEGVRQPVYDLCFRPDGTQLIVAAGQRVLVYDTAEGALVDKLRGHEGTVYCVAYSHDGKRFASGGADRIVVIWTSELSGILKYTHGDSVQCVTYNPITQQLTSCTESDFGLWSPEQKSVDKTKINSKILCASWTPDGQYLALGLINGTISIRDRKSQEKLRINRPGPVWSISWNPNREEHDTLAVADWGGAISFYQLNGRQIGRDKPVCGGGVPCTVSHFSNGKYLVVGGTNKEVGLHSADGTHLLPIANKEGWIWASKQWPKQNYVAIGTNDGTVALVQLQFATVHGLYGERYAYRDYMTNVVIQNLISDQKSTIVCREYVRKIAIYKDRLAVQLPDHVVVYELSESDDGTTHYHALEKVPGKLDSNLLVVTSQNIILCMEKRLQLLDFHGVKQREWILDSMVRYIKVVGGPRGKEGVLVGLKNGSVLKVFVNNPFPVPLVEVGSCIRCLDLSKSRKKVAAVDADNNVKVYDLATKKLLFSESGASSVSWNAQFEDMLAYSGNGLLNIKAGDFPTHQQKMQGFVVGFRGSRVFCLHLHAIVSVDMPQSATLRRYLEKREFDQAYEVACLGVTLNDWERLGSEALLGVSLDIARKAYIRLRNMHYVDLIDKLDKEKGHAGYDMNLFQAEVLASQGRFVDSARLFVKAKRADRAVDMLTDLKMWEAARKIAGEAEGFNSSELLKKQAMWNEESGDWQAAVEMWMGAGDLERAIKLIDANDGMDRLVEISRRLPKTDRTSLELCAEVFRQHGEHLHAAETYMKLGDLRPLLSLYVEQNDWEEAFALHKKIPGSELDVYLPYARWLAMNDRFEEAQEAYTTAGRGHEAMYVLQQLLHNSVVESKFDAAGYYSWMLATQNLKEVKHSFESGDMTEQEEKHFDKFVKLMKNAEAYYAFDGVHKYAEDPFTSKSTSQLFHAAVMLLNRIGKGEAPHGVAISYVVHCLAKQASALEAFKLARLSYERLSISFKIPSSWQDAADLAALSIRPRPFSDPEDLLPICARCQSQGTILSNNGDQCNSCHQTTERSFVSFEPLPLLEFTLARGISDEEAETLINMEPPVKPRVSKGKGKGNTGSDGVDRMEMDSDDEDEGLGDDYFTDMLQRQLAETDTDTMPVFDRETLRGFKSTDVLIRKWPSPAMPVQYYRIMIRESPVVMCPRCLKFFYEEDWETALLENPRCPFCRLPQTLGE